MSRVFIGLATVVLLGLGGCSSSEPAPDFKTSYADLSQQVNEMSSTLEAIPDKFDLATRKKVEVATELLDSTVAKLEQQVKQYHDAWEELRGYRNMNGELDESQIDEYVAAMERFKTQWQRISTKNEQAMERLWVIKQMVDDATSA